MQTCLISERSWVDWDLVGQTRGNLFRCWLEFCRGRTPNTVLTAALLVLSLIRTCDQVGTYLIFCRKGRGGRQKKHDVPPYLEKTFSNYKLMWYTVDRWDYTIYIDQVLHQLRRSKGVLMVNLYIYIQYKYTLYKHILPELWRIFSQHERP